MYLVFIHVYTPRSVPDQRLGLFTAGGLVGNAMRIGQGAVSGIPCRRSVGFSWDGDFIVLAEAGV